MLLFLALGYTLPIRNDLALFTPSPSRCSFTMLSEERINAVDEANMPSTLEKKENEAGVWLAAMLITGSAEIGRATGISQDNSTDLEAAVTTVGAAAALKVAATVATKVVATGVTLAVAGPTVKAATTVAALGQMAYERRQGVKKERERLEAERERVEADELAERLAAIADVSVRRQAEAEAKRQRAARLASALTRLQPSRTKWPPSPRRIFVGVFIGAVLGSVLPQSSWFRTLPNPTAAAVRKMAEIAIASVLASRAMKGLCSLSKEMLAANSKALALAVANREEATAAANNATAAAAFAASKLVANETTRGETL